MNEDISKGTLLVLVVLTVIISVLGTWTVITEANKVSFQRSQSSGHNSASGHVSIGVVTQQAPVQATGKISLTIIPPE